MKRLLLFAGFLSVILLASSQKPEKIYSIAKVLKSESYYKEQIQLWEKEILDNPSNAEAWYNYYAASRALRNISHGDAERKQYSSLCDSIAKECYSSVPETFQANIVKYWNSGNDPDHIEYLFKAYELDPEDPRSYDGMMIWGELKDGIETRRKFARKLYESGTFSSSFLNWGYNMMMELPEEAVVFTAGDNDTYAAWLCQDVKNIKTNVKVLNLSLLFLDDYRSNKFDELGLPKFTKTADDFTHYHDFGKAILDHILTNYKHDKYFAVTISDHLKNQYADSLYLTGLTYKYCSYNFDNISIIKRNYEHRYLMNYIHESFTHDISEDVANRLNTTYLPAMIKLYKHYKQSENLILMQKIKNEIIILAEKGGMQSEILGHFEEESAYPWLSAFKNTMLDVKDLEKSMLKFSDNLYMGKYEVTNVEYQRFLANLNRSKNIEAYEMCLYDSSQWTKFGDTEYNNPMQQMYHWHPAYEEYPVVNISYDAARKYCEWLTVQYNSQHKRRYNKVHFRLPTESEWRKAANADAKAETPWGTMQGNDPKKECYLANFKNSKDRFMDDGAMYTAKVNSYKPNETGLYNMLGNVAEMIDEKGKAKGGSWAHLLEDCYLSKTVNYSGADPRVGFRVLMEIIED